MKNNSFIDTVVNEIRAEADLAWEQLQNGGDEEARVAYNYLNALLVKMERDRHQDVTGRHRIW